MYPNLELEMFKQKVSTKQLAQICGISESGMRKKLNGEFDFKLREVEKIMDRFSTVPWQYLFARDEEKNDASA